MSEYDSDSLPLTAEEFHNYLSNEIRRGKSPPQVIIENYSYNDCLELINRFRRCQCCLRHKQNFPFLNHDKNNAIP